MKWSHLCGTVVIPPFLYWCLCFFSRVVYPDSCKYQSNSTTNVADLLWLAHLQYFLLHIALEATSSNLHFNVGLWRVCREEPPWLVYMLIPSLNQITQLTKWPPNEGIDPHIDALSIKDDLYSNDEMNSSPNNLLVVNRTMNQGESVTISREMCWWPAVCFTAPQKKEHFTQKRHYSSP